MLGGPGRNGFTWKEQLAFEELSKVKGESIYHQAIANVVTQGDAAGFRYTCEKLKIMILEDHNVRKILGEKAYKAVMSLPDSETVRGIKTYQMIAANIKKCNDYLQIQNCKEAISKNIEVIKDWNRVNQLHEQLLWREVELLSTHYPMVEG